ncbi:MAG: CoA-binding protein, partial [Dehalococcoidales bacterium]|nr:CoA-binding protein [Dehalococcoidales bacterium]
MNRSDLDFLFKPGSIAIAGVSIEENGINMGRDFVQAFIDAGYKGKLYPINPRGGEVLGLKVYRNIMEIEGPVDYVISAVPSKYTEQLMTDCVSKHVRAVHLFTAGFGEIQDEAGKHLQEQILSIAKPNNIRLIGPNCMGIYCPKNGITYARELRNQPAFSRTAGHVSFISQSGGNSIYCIRKATAAGIYFSKVVSYGNAVDI